MVRSVSGVSNVMSIKSLSAFTAKAIETTKSAIIQARQINGGAQGNSKINIKA